MTRRLILAVTATIFLSGCDVFDDDNGSTPPTPPANTQEVDVDLTPDQVIDMGTMGAAGTATLTLNLDDGTLSGSVTLNGVDADNVTLNIGFAGEVGELHTSFTQDNATTWSLPDNTVLSETDRDRFAAGGLYLLATSTQNPDGALRGQILTGDVRLLLTQLSGMQVVPMVVTMSSARGFLTLDNASGQVVAHVHVMGADDALLAHIHQSSAGVNGGVLIDLFQDSDPGLWSSDGATFDAAGLEALDSGLLYYQVHTPAHPGGELRGQIVPEGLEIEFTALTGDDVVIPGMDGIDTEATAIAATTLDTGSSQVDIHLNTGNLADASSASLNVAPEGQNGPLLVGLEQDANNSNHWFVEDYQFSSQDIDDLRDQLLYFTVANPTWPNGIIRGQWRPENSSPPVPGETFEVTSVVPNDGFELTEFPAEITVTFNGDIDGATASTGTVILTASGNDGSFNDGNEQEMTPLVINTADNLLTIDTSSLTPTDDVFMLRLLGTGDAPITDSFGNVLDGDSDQTAGGDFTSTFSVVTEMGSEATFTFIQENVFTPNCTFSGCHSGAAPAQGQNLTAGQAYSNIVNVPSTEVPSLLRIEPGDPDNSYMIQKLEGTAAVGSRMPLGMAPLSAETIQIMRQWVTEGAQDN